MSVANCFPSRSERGQQIADLGLIRQDGDAFYVRSSPDGREYRVWGREDGAPMCSCADAQFNGAFCKHQRAIPLWLEKRELERSQAARAVDSETDPEPREGSHAPSLMGVPTQGSDLGTREVHKATAGGEASTANCPAGFLEPVRQSEYPSLATSPRELESAK